MNRQDHPSSAPARVRRGRISIPGIIVVSMLILVAMASISAAIFVWVIQREDNSTFLREQLISSLKSGLGPGHELVVNQAALQLDGVHPVFSLSGLSVSHAETGASATLASAGLTLQTSSLWRLSPEATGITFDGLAIVLPVQPHVAANAGMVPVALHPISHMLNTALGAQSGPMVRLKRIDGRGISVMRRMPDGSTTLLRDDLTLTARRVEGGMSMTLSRPVLQGGQTGLQAGLEVVGTRISDADGRTNVRIENSGVSVGTLEALFGVSVAGLDPKLDISARLQGVFDANGKPGASTLSFGMRNGIITFPDPDVPPIPLDQFSLDLSAHPDQPGVDVSRIVLAFGEARIEAKGSLTSDTEGAVRLRLVADRAVLDRLSPQDDLVALDRLAVEGVIASDAQSFVLDRLDIADGAGRAQISGRFSLANGGLIETNIIAENLDLRRVLRIWPVSVAPEVRRWTIAHAEAGLVKQIDIKSSLAGQALADSFAKRPIPDDAMRASFRVERAKVRPLGDAAPIEQGVLSALITGRRAAITLESGQILLQPAKTLHLKGAEFIIANTAQKPAVLDMKIPFSGGIDAMLAFLSAPSLKSFVSLPSDIAITEGQVDAVAQVVMRMVAKPGPSDVQLDLRGDLRNVTVENIIKGEKLEGGQFQLLGRAGTTTLKGEARIGANPAQIELRAEPGKPVLVTLKTVLDDAARAKRGLDFRPILTGPVGVQVDVQFLKGQAPDIDLDIDLTRAKIEGIVPGFIKKPGQVGRISFDYALKADRTILDDFTLDLGAISAAGKLEIGKDGQLAKAELASFKLSPGDNVRMAIERNKGSMKLVLRGNSFDLRPFLRGFQSGKIDDSKSTDLDLDIQTTVLVGFNNELISAADVQAVRRAGLLTKLNVKGKFGGAGLSVETTNQKPDHITLQIETMDAGALIRFMDIYPRMYGGRLSSEILVGNAGQRGLVQIWDFNIRGEPVLRQYAGIAHGGGPMSSTAGARNSESVHFTKLRADFVRKPGRLDLNEAVMWGGQIGGSLEGYLDYAGDKVDLKGSLVPAYAVNNLFSQLPLLGPIFGGSQYEGLFALPFVISGKASAPLLRTNALSVIAPGFLRKVFEFQREGSPR